MIKDISNQLIPQQYTGSQSESSAFVIAGDEFAAKQLFSLGKERLLAISNWNLLCGVVTSTFQLVDREGSEVQRAPLRGDYIRIDIPGPGPTSGKGFDWVCIENLNDIEIDAHQELFFMQVRPAAHPGDNSSHSAHFFDSSATSTFMIVRELSQVTATIYGRNEVPNTETDNNIDNIRNKVIGSSAATGLSVLQWKSLVSGLLKTDLLHSS